MSSYIVGIVDDDAIYRFTAQKVIEKTNVAEKILIFTDGEEVYDFLEKNLGDEQQLPDIIFLDINMPNMDGWEFLNQYTHIKPKLSKKIVIYMVSSSVSDADISRAEGISEVSGYLVKPITIDKFKELIENLSLIG